MLQVASKFLVIAQVIAVIAKRRSAEKTGLKQTLFSKNPVFFRKTANRLQFYCGTFAALLQNIRSTTANSPQ